MLRHMNQYKISLLTLLATMIVTIPYTASQVAAAPNLQSEPADNTSTAHHIYLPFVSGEKQTPKQWSGIHLGNILTASRYEWSPTQFWYIDPTRNPNVTWPPLIVVQSNQIYEINRDENTTGCPITNATIRLPKAFQYLQAAAQAGSKIIIRITPSPGSFISWQEHPPINRQMVVVDPVGALKTWLLNEETQEYYLTNAPATFEEPINCTFNLNGEERNSAELYRSLRDIADEIKAIYDLNRAFGWAEYGFEPANEPNIEWFANIDQNANPIQTHPGAWDMMDLYFYYLVLRINEMQTTTPNFQPKVFTPPMVQSEYEAGLWLEYCQKDRYFKDENGDPLLYSTGYERMRNAIEASDGFSWHNYWNPGNIFERYTDCNEESQEGGQHISYYFPAWLKNHLKTSGKPLIVTEVDLFSPWQSEYRVSAVTNKSTQATATADSLRTFLKNEYNALQQEYPNNPTYFAVWLLNDNIYSIDQAPADENCNRDNICITDHNWHEAYQDEVEQLQTFEYSTDEITQYGLPPGSTYTINQVQVRAWFTQWWNGSEE